MNPDFAELQVPTTWLGHKLDEVLAGMEDDDARAVIEALEDPSIPTLRIWRALDYNGYKVSRNTVVRWRKRHAEASEVQA